VTERRSDQWSEFPDFVNDYDIVVQVTGRVAVFGGGVSVFLCLGGLTRLQGVRGSDVVMLGRGVIRRDGEMRLGSRGLALSRGCGGLDWGFCGFGGGGHRRVSLFLTAPQICDDGAPVERVGIYLIGALRQRPGELGWHEDDIDVIDADLEALLCPRLRRRRVPGRG